MLNQTRQLLHCLDEYLVKERQSPSSFNIESTMAMRNRRLRWRSHPEKGSGRYAPSISFVYQSEQVQIELKKTIQSGEERTLVLTSEEFFQISFQSNEIHQVGKLIADFGDSNSIKTKSNEETFPHFSMIVVENNDRQNEHMYEWKVNSTLHVSVRNRRNDGRRPIDAHFVVEIRRFNQLNHPTDNGIMMAWHNFEGTFVHYRQERRNRIREMEEQIRSKPKSFVEKTFSTETIVHDEQSNDECVICLDKFGQNEQITQLAKCQHKFHRNCISTWLRGSDHCPLCRTKVDSS